MDNEFLNYAAVGPGAKKALAEIWNAEDRRAATTAFTDGNSFMIAAMSGFGTRPDSQPSNCQDLWMKIF